MTLADKITSLRIILAPLFFIIYLAPVFFPALPVNGSGWTVPVLWALFIVSQITDMIDGMVARGRKEVSDFGKLFDPFADTLAQITFFLCFVIDGLLPVVLYLAVLYREFCILFMRNLMLRKGIAMGARIGGKIKTVVYILAEIAALLAASVNRLDFAVFLFPFFKTSALIIFILSVILSIISFFDYLSVYKGKTT
ncbi:MAG: CDP-diacylglycerol--glycerol-3-phosphate 3-phosphatidyltransferase [Treponema sp.]|jgi:CDP-diacylglycerol--glycerol-3-phosphate 3-phosphatidyltransferase|nr:CDP-diacylglycerol--glycerol-3-phosphate 3-phosphatidyltransferase [Treponema sp.]